MGRRGHWDMASWKKSEARKKAEDRLRRILELVFRPILEAMDPQSRNAITRVKDAFYSMFKEDYFSDLNDVQALEDQLARSIKLLRKVDLFNFEPAEFLRGHDIGEAYAAAWCGAMRTVFQPNLVKRRIRKVWNACDNNRLEDLEEDYPEYNPDWVRDWVDPSERKLFLDTDLIWINKVLEQLENPHVYDYDDPPTHIRDFMKQLRQHKADCAIRNAEWERIQKTDDSERKQAMEAWEEKVLSMVSRSLSLRAKAKILLDM